MSNTPTLFHPRALSKTLEKTSALKNGVIPPKANKILQQWHELITSGKIKKHKEKNFQTPFISEICTELLGYKPATKQSKGTWSLTAETTVKRGSVDICLGKFTDNSQDKQVMFELKGADTTDMDRRMHGRKLSAVNQAREYALNSKGEAQWVMVSNMVEIRLYKYPESGNDYESWQIADLIEPAEYDRFMLLLSHKNLISGKTQRLYALSLKTEKDITNQLYADYREIRVQLINGMKRENNKIRRAAMVGRAQTLLDRVLFIAFAEDRDLLPDRTLENYLERTSEFRSSWELLRQLFTDIDKGSKQREIPKFNGDLFKPDDALDELDISDELLSNLKRLWEYDFATDISETILGRIFEQSIADLDQIYEAVNEDSELQLTSQTHGTTGKRKKDGVVYTPDFITTWIVEHTLGAYLDKQKQAFTAEEDSLAWWQAYRDLLATTRICDPACGSGAFLVAAYKYLKREFKSVNARLAELGEVSDLFSKRLNDDILNNNLFGVDINAESVEIARLSLWLATAEPGKPLTSLKENIKQGNSVIHHKNADKNAFGWKKPFCDFDVVLGNPPYVRQERLSDIKPYLEKHYQTYHGVADLYTYFFELGLKILKKDGYMGYISSSTFFKTGSGEGLRKHLSIDANIQTIVDFGDLQIFEGVTTYPAILIMNKPSSKPRNQPPKMHKVTFWNVSSGKLDDLKTEMQQPKWGQISQRKLATDGWRLEDERLQALRQKIIGTKKTLKDVYGSPLYGVKTGRNEAFVIDGHTKDLLIAEDPKSLELIKPFFEGKDLKKWRSESRNLFLIFTRRGIEIDKYPAIKKHLEQYRSILEPKPKTHPKGKPWKGRKTGTYKWFEIQDSVDYFSAFDRPKIIYSEFSKKPNFSFDSENAFTNNKCFFIPLDDEFLLGLLNSSVLWFVISGICTFVRGGYYELRTIRMETLPIPKASETQKEEISASAENCQTLAEQRYQLENAFRLEIPSLCPADREAKLNNKLKSWWLLSFDAFKTEIKKQFKQAIPLQDTSEWRTWFEKDKTAIQTLSNQLANAEQTLNAQVYKLFRLNQEEIDLLEESLN
ncbi:MAG: N-6 DNA methylase [uncultured Thiotrichaceae bacterium]|uniref:site-specific DNA-methyltransferase (adenine-specific) n=1 Tax=uncultured Thiotrichaceae bacterium TaxID=298394 RepID=A0A6S6SEW4_9GAMM|nr:MAG: N-6 DNA methylase [uncultured Thiotrichaceae bacterium]